MNQAQKVMTYRYYVLSTVTIFQACHLMYDVESLPKTFMSQDILLDLRKSYKIVSTFIGWEIGGAKTPHNKKICIGLITDVVADMLEGN